MNEASAASVTPRPKAPVQFWIVSALSLTWNFYLAVDFSLTRTRNMAYIEAVMGDAQAALAWIDASPAWVIAAWAISIWGALAGSVLLLARSRHAVSVFLIALACTAINSLRQYVSIPASLDTAEMEVMLWVLLLVAGFWWWYARRAAARGILR